MIPIPIGPEPAPEHRWVGAPQARRIRSRCTTTGALLLLWAPVAVVATLFLGGRLPTADHPIHGIGMILAVAAAVPSFIVGVAALGARRHVSAEHVDVAGGRLMGRGMLAMAVLSVVFAVLAGAVLLLTAGAVERIDAVQGATAAVGGFLVLPGSCGVLALVGAVLARGALRPPIPPAPRQVGP